jgi:hypothetical protein
MAKGRKNTGNLKIEVPKSETESSKINIKIDVKINERVEVTKDQESDNNDFFDI